MAMGDYYNLPQASESPGGWPADKLDILPPSSYQPTSFTYDPLTFEAVVEAYDSFIYKTNGTTPTEKTKVEHLWLENWILKSSDEITFMATVDEAGTGTGTGTGTDPDPDPEW